MAKIYKLSPLSIGETTKSITEPILAILVALAKKAPAKPGKIDSKYNLRKTIIANPAPTRKLAFMA